MGYNCLAFARRNEVGRPPRWDIFWKRKGGDIKGNNFSCIEILNSKYKHSMTNKYTKYYMFDLRKYHNT